MSNTPSTKLLAVLGATGAQGGAILRHFALHRPDFRLRGLTRDPTSTNSQQLASLGVDMVRADLHDEASLRSAFTDATHIFANIDSVSLIMEGIFRPELLQGQSHFERGAEQEKLLARNLINAAAASTSLERIVWSALPGVKERSGGEKPDGSYELSLALTGDEKLPFANVELDAGGWCAALLDAEAGIKLVGCSEMLTWKEWLRKWEKQNGVQAQFRQCSEEEQMGFMGGAGGVTLQSMSFVAEYGMAGGDAEAILPRNIVAPARGVSEAMSRVDWSKII
ncbi:Hypothetical protein D9617_6g093520 [Elsinoe fawcettii]|nr:Hypothetical protein D9617_6g093520 [Elsinoe fawcettii]